MSTDNKIILINDILDFRKRKEKELIFYKEKLEELIEKIKLVQKEVNLTNDIIKIIEQEKVVEIKPKS